MSQPLFFSVLAPVMNEFVAFKRSQGYKYDSDGATLWHFDRFLLRSAYDHQALSADILERYAAALRRLAPNTQYGRLSAARVFARWLRRLVPGSAVIETIPVRRPTLPRYYLYSRQEVVAIIRHARQAGGRSGAPRPLCYATLVGLLYVTGLRIGEALALDLGDLDLAAARLTVRRGKLGKARNIALSPSTAAALSRYLDARLGLRPNGRDAPLFLDTRGQRLSYGNASTRFRSMVRACGAGAGAACPPRLHDLRHTYACDCLHKWYDEGVDVNARLPVLATAMGHVNIHDTQLYLHVTAQLLQVAASRFHNTFTSNTQGAPQ